MNASSPVKQKKAEFLKSPLNLLKKTCYRSFSAVDLLVFFATIAGMTSIEILTAFGDNYIYLVEYEPQSCFVVDPGDAEPVQAFIRQHNLKLTHILTTHHHSDHIGGIGELKKTSGCEIIGPDKQRIAGIDTFVQDGDVLEVGEMSIRCIATPGHTATEVCYYGTGKEFDTPVLFTGDTLFVCGCGRLFECDGETMFKSLQKLAGLPGETLIYPGHNYTGENLQFALTVEPDNDALKKKLNAVQQQNQHNRPTVPSTLANEKQLNPFLKALNWQEFAELRKKKDMF